MKRDLFALALIVVVIGFFCKEILFDRMSPHRGDIAVQFYPWKEYTRSMLASGEIPYWNPYTHGGSPFMANVQSAVFYPLDLILFLFPMERFFGLSLLLHLWLAGIGTFLLARQCGANSLPAAIAGVAYGLNGFTMIHLPFGNHLTYAGAAWAPWLFWAAVGFALTKNSRLPWALAGSLIACLHFLCGHPQMAFYSLVFSVLLCAFLGVAMAYRETVFNLYPPLFRTAVWGVFLTFGIMLAGFQFFPTLEYLGYANRATSIGVEAATEFSFAPHRVITLFFPEFYGTHIGGNHYDNFVYWSCAYTGVIVPILAIALFVVDKRRSVTAIPLAVAGLLALLTAWGRGNPFYALLYQLPGFGSFRAPAKYLPYYLMSVCVLAALGLDRLSVLAYEAQQKKPKSDLDLFRKAGLIILLAVLFFYGSRIFSNLTNELRKTDGVTNAGMIRSLSLAYGVLMGLSAVALYLFARRFPRYPRLALSLSMLFLLSLDLFIYGKGYLYASLLRTSQIRSQCATPQEIGAIKADEKSLWPDRVVTLSELPYPDLFLSWKTPNIAGYDPMSLRSYNRLIGRMEGWEDRSYHDNIEISHTDHPVLDLLNVRYVLTLQTLDLLQLKFLYQGQDFRVYERINDTRSWGSIIPWSEEKPLSDAPWKNIDRELSFKTLSPHEIVFSYSPDRHVWLRVSEWAYPGWKAKALLEDGTLVDIETVNSDNGLRILDLPNETREVSLFYDPPYFGWIVSGIAWLIFVMLLGLYLLGRTDYGLKIVQVALGRRGF